MKKFLRYIKSLRLSLFLLIILVPLIALGNIIPQKGRFSPAYINEWKESNPFLSVFTGALGLDHLYTTWWFTLLFIVLFLNITLITWDLFKRTYRKSRGMHRFTGDAPQYLVLDYLHYSREWLDSLERSLRKRRYGIIKVGGEIYGRKGWIGIWGGTLLHIGLVVVLSGAVVSGLFRFNGYAELGEGQHMFDREEYYISANRGILFPGHRRDVAIQLRRVEYREEGKIKHLYSTITVTDGKESTVTKTIRMNEPLKFKGLKIYQARISGPSLLFLINKTSGSEKGYVNLEPFKDNRTSVLFSIPGTPYQAKADYERGKDLITIEIRKAEKLLYRGDLQENRPILLEDNTFLVLDAIKRWIGVIVVFDPGVPLVFSGFVLSVLGIALMALFDPREIWARFKKDKDGEFIELLGWGRWKNMFLDEFQEIKEEIRE